MLRTLVSRSIMAVLAVVVVAFFILLVLYCSGNESLANGSHHRSVHAAKTRDLPPIRKCEYTGGSYRQELAPCGCPVYAVSEDSSQGIPVLYGPFGEGARNIKVSFIGKPEPPHPSLKWHSRNARICAVYEEYQDKSAVFHSFRVKTGPTSGHAVMKWEVIHLVFWMKKN